MHLYNVAMRYGKHMRLHNAAAAKAKGLIDARPDEDAEGRVSEAFEMPAGFGTRYDPGPEEKLRSEGYAAVEEGYDTSYKGYESSGKK